MEDETIKEIGEHLDAAKLVIYAYLSGLFGSFKNVPDDHPLFKAVKAIESARSLLPDVEEDDEAPAGRKRTNSITPTSLSPKIEHGTRGGAVRRHRNGRQIHFTAAVDHATGGPVTPEGGES
jgi:hypothetical protein